MYSEHLNSLINSYQQSQDMSIIDAKMIDFIRACTAGCNDENENEAIGYSTTKFEEAIKNEMYRAFAQDAIKARRKMSELINSNNDGIALAASREVLNKAGYIETQKVETTVKEINIEITE